MTTIRYVELLNDRQVFKANNELDFQCISYCRRYTIGVYYNPPDLKNEEPKSVLNKPFLGVFPSSQFDDPTKPILKNDQIFLMFSESFDKAFTFVLSFNCDIGKASLKVLDMPNYNEGLISDREIIGIEKQIHPGHIKFLRPLTQNH